MTDAEKSAHNLKVAQAKERQAVGLDELAKTTGDPVYVTMAQQKRQQAQYARDVAAGQAQKVSAQPPVSQTNEVTPGGSGGGKKQVKCPQCQSLLIENDYKQKEETLEGFAGLSGFAARIPLIGRLVPKVSLKQTLYDKECSLCGNTSYIVDKADTTRQALEAARVAQQESKEILELEAKLGPVGGNRHTIVVGDDMLEVGLGFNDCKSYKIVEEGQISPTGGTIESKASLPGYRKTTAVVGTNPLPIPGGHYHIKCGNKFSLFAGSQGVDIDSTGPVTIRGGITKLLGPEITLGSSVGQTLIEGDNVQIIGKGVAITMDPAGPGQATIQGTLHSSGNLKVDGGAHIDGDLSFISATCPGRVERSRVGAGPDQTTGPAQWSSQAITSGLKDFIRKTVISIADPTSIALSPRGQQNIQQEMLALLKKALPLESEITGLCVISYGSSSGVHPIFNFPHHHTLADGTHGHDSFVPNVKLVNTSTEVRKNAKAKEGPAPVGISEPSSNIFQKIGQSILGVLTNRIKP